MHRGSDAELVRDAHLQSRVTHGHAAGLLRAVLSLRWREHIDLVAITVNQQIRHGVLGTPKGRTRRVVPMTPTLHAELKTLQLVRTGHVLRNLDDSPVTDSQARDAMYRICHLAGIPERGWHVLRHSFGTHAAMLGVNPWRLQTWMGHKRIDETMLYVNFAGAHMRPIPPTLLLAAGADSRSRPAARAARRREEGTGGGSDQCALQDSKTFAPVRRRQGKQVRRRIPSATSNPWERPVRRSAGECG